MIKTPLSGKVEFLGNIQHSLFIHSYYRELHLWDEKKLKETLMQLENHSVTVDSIVKIDDFYKLTF